MRNNNVLLIVAAILLLGGGGVVVYNMTRGLRNNNPGNIKDDGVTAWEGLANPRNDGTFLIFTSPEYGFRAWGRILTNYVNADGVQPTVTGIVSRWAPPSENDTASYISDVAGQLGIDPNASFDLSSGIVALLGAMTQHENGINPYSAQTIASGVALA